MEPTKQELKTITTALRVSSKYGSEKQKEFNKKRVEKLAEKLKEVQDIPTRKVIIEEIKSHNKKQSFNAVNKAIDDLVTKYNVIVDEPGAKAGDPLTPRMPEYKPGLRGKKPQPPPKETTPAPRPKLKPAQEKAVGKGEEEEKEEKKPEK